MMIDGQQRGEVVARPDLWEPANRDDLDTRWPVGVGRWHACA